MCVICAKNSANIITVSSRKHVTDPVLDEHYSLKSQARFKSRPSNWT